MIYIASDHRGYDLKTDILEKHPDFLDLGPSYYDPEDDYNEFAIKIAENVRDGARIKNVTPAVDPPAFGIIICGSAHGVSIQCNRFKGIRAIVGLDEELARIGREHNNANVLCLSADFTPKKDIEKIIDVFLTTKARTEQKYARRNIKLDRQGEN